MTRIFIITHWFYHRAQHSPWVTQWVLNQSLLVISPSTIFHLLAIFVLSWEGMGHSAMANSMYKNIIQATTRNRKVSAYFCVYRAVLVCLNQFNFMMIAD